MEVIETEVVGENTVTELDARKINSSETQIKDLLIIFFILSEGLLLPRILKVL